MGRTCHVGPALVLAAILAHANPAPAQTWTAAVSTNWNTAGNWNPAGIPNSATADVIFGFTGAGLVNIATSVQAQSLTIDSVAGGAYTLTSSASQTLTGVSTITVSGTISNVQTINLANVAAGNLLVPGTGAGALTIDNEAAATPSTTPRLLIGVNTIIGRSGAGTAGITVTGTGTTQIGGTILSTMNGGLTKAGPGNLVIFGLNNGSGTTTVSGGTLVLDYSTAASSKLPSGGLTIGGANLTLIANPAANLSEAVSSTMFTAGHSHITVDTNNGSLAQMTLTLGNISRAVGSTVDFVPQAGGAITTTAGLVNGILGGFATTVGGSGWATKSGSNIVALTAYGMDIYSPGTNTEVTAPAVTQFDFTTNSLKFNQDYAQTLTLHGTNTVQSGGVLIGQSANAVTITGGTLATAGESLRSRQQ